MGLDSLLDGIDALQLNDDAYDLNLDYLLEDDEWSEPASSIEGALGVTFEL